MVVVSHIEDALKAFLSIWKQTTIADHFEWNLRPAATRDSAPNRMSRTLGELCEKSKDQCVARKLPTPRMCDAAGSELSGDDEEARKDCEHDHSCARSTQRQIAPWQNQGEQFSGIVLGFCNTFLCLASQERREVVMRCSPCAEEQVLVKYGVRHSGRKAFHARRPALKLEVNTAERRT